MKDIRQASSKRKVVSLQTVRWMLRERIWKDRKLRMSTRFILTVYLDRITMDYTTAEWKKTGKIVVWGSQEELAHLIGCSAATVARAFKQAEQCGYVTQVQRGNQYGGSNVFEIASLDELDVREAREHPTNC